MTNEQGVLFVVAYITLLIWANIFGQLLSAKIVTRSENTRLKLKVSSRRNVGRE